MMRKIILFFGALLLCHAAVATHQRAGEITYKHLNGLTYEFTIITYTYTPSQADRPEIEVFWGDNSSSTVTRQTKTSVGVDISKNVYVTTHSYGTHGIYSVTFEDPNRNAGIINIPNSVNIPFFIETIVVINPFLGSNNSVLLLNPPLDNGCLHTTYYHNVGAYDHDGDSLSFKLIDCRGLDGLPIPGYSLPQASQYISIDEITGDLIWETPTMQGEYNIAILISEYRKGQFMGSVVRDMQITVAACNNKAPQIFCSDTCVIAGTELVMDIFVTDNPLTQVTLTATGGPYLVATNPAIPISVLSYPPFHFDFTWKTHCSHVKKSPYQLFLKAIDHDTVVPLASFKTVNINVIAPAPQNLTANPIKNTIVLEWDTCECRNAANIHIYRKSGNSSFNPDICETGIPPDAGFQLLAKTSGSAVRFTDDGTSMMLAHGREYCYRIVAVFANGAESIASNEVCAAIATDAPMITHIDVTQTHEKEGTIFVSWLIPPEIDQIHFSGQKYEYRIFRSANDKYHFEYLTSKYSLFDTSFFDNALNTKHIQYYYKIEFWGENNAGVMELIEVSNPASSVFLTIYETDKRLELTWNEEVAWENYTYIVYRFNDQTQQFDSIATTMHQKYEDWDLTNGTTYCYLITSVGRYVIPDTVAPFYNRSQVACGIPIDNIPPDMPDIKITTDCKNVSFLWSFPNPDSYLDAYWYYIYYQPNYKTEFFCIDSFTYASPCYGSPCSHIIQNLPSTTGCYTMLIKDVVGNVSQMPPKLCFDVEQCETYRLPNVFTPDGDGVNEFWIPFPYTNVEKIDLVVYDRWGKRVFKTEDPDINWDGKHEHSARPLPEGTYFYGCELFLYTLDGIKTKMLTGTVMILRSNSKKQNY